MRHELRIDPANPIRVEEKVVGEWRLHTMAGTPNLAIAILAREQAMGGVVHGLAREQAMGGVVHGLTRERANAALQALEGQADRLRRLIEHLVLALEILE